MAVLAAFAFASPRPATHAGQTVNAPAQHQSVVVNIEVPVRVLKKDAFVGGLALQDFEVYEDGVRQSIEAVYLIKDKRILREEKAVASAPPPPQSARHFVLYLDLNEYLPRIGTALDFFFTEVIKPGDTLNVVTPAKSYRFKSEALSRFSGQQIADNLKAKLRVDVQFGNSQYRNLMKDFYSLEQTEFPPEQADLKEQMLFDIAAQIRDLTEITEKNIAGFAETLKSLDGDRHVFLFLQKDVLPEHAFEAEKQAELIKPVGFDVEKIARIFSDASITVHFLYITKKPDFAVDTSSVGRPSLAFSQQDVSADIYASFKEIARSTGGLTESTANPHSALRHAAEASSHYYLLYYKPNAYRADGGFRKIEVRVKEKGLQVFHRAGYIAD